MNDSPHDQSDTADERWDDDTATVLVGKRALVGVTYLEAQGERHEQMFGTVVAAERRRGIDVALAGNRAGEVLTLPPDTKAFRKAEPGHYKLRGSGEVVVDPDYTVTYTVYPRRSGAGGEVV